MVNRKVAGKKNIRAAMLSISDESGLSVSLKYKPEAWLLEEYKLLSAHYFHEDNYFQHSVATFSTLNSGLVAFYASNLVTEVRAARFMVPTIGIIISMVWEVSLLRTRERRVYAEHRIEKIESVLHDLWQVEGSTLEMPLDIGTRARWKESGKEGAWGKTRLGWIRNIPASILALFLPPLFIAIWILLLFVF